MAHKKYQERVVGEVRTFLQALATKAGGETARSVGIGLSPGDHYYPQPYVYVSPSPHLKAADLWALPPPGHWHTQGFVGAVATGDEILALDDRRVGLCAFVRAACETGRAPH